MALDTSSVDLSSTASVIPYKPNFLEATETERKVIVSPFFVDKRGCQHYYAKGRLRPSIYSPATVDLYVLMPIAEDKTYNVVSPTT